MSSEGIKARNIRPFVILLGLVAIILVVMGQFEIGLTLIAIAGLMTTGVFIIDRLRRIGAESWALGSIIVGLGFTLLTIPVIGFAWNLFSSTVEILLFVGGVTTMILGYTTEYYDLNAKFLKFISRAKFQFYKITHQFRSKVLRSIWTILSIVLLFYLIASFLIPTILTPISYLIPPTIISERWVIVFTIILLLIIEFRELIAFFILRFIELIGILFNGVIRRLMQLRGMIRTLLVNLWSGMRGFFYNIRTFLTFMFDNPYTFGVSGFLVFGIISLIQDDDALGHFALIILIITLTLVFYKYEERLGSQLRGTQQRLYNASFFVRRLFRKSRLINCPRCNAGIQSSSIHCFSCQQALPKCSICRDVLEGGSLVDKCSNCENTFHSEHIESWVQIRAICPICKENWVSA